MADDDQTGKQRYQDNRKAGVGLPGQSVKGAVKKYRAQQQAAGVRGPALRESVKAYRGQARAAQDEEALQYIPESYRPYVKDPSKFLNTKMGSRFRRMAGVQHLSTMGEYGQDERDALSKHYLDSLPGEGELTPQMDFREGTTPGFDAAQQYALAHVDPATGTMKGLSDPEVAMYRGAGRDVAETNYRTNMGNEMTRMAAAGLDPRSGIGAARAAGYNAQRGQELQGVERNLVQQDLTRKRDFEGMLGQLAGAEESRRQYDVGQSYNRLGQVESGLGGLYGTGEQARAHDLDLVEGQYQSRLSRLAMEKAGRMMKPTGLEQAGAVIGGITSGLGGMSK